jgi:hypothetical protein
MNIDYVDYYGKYEDLDDNDFTFSVSDIHNKQRQKDLRRLYVYKSILGKVYKKIKNASVNEESYCFFEVPEYIYGTPLYNMKDCVIFILNNLHEKGFSAKYVDPLLIFVCWNLPKPNLRITDLPKLTDPSPQVQRAIQDASPQYRPIENFQGSGNYLYNQTNQTNRTPLPPPAITNYSHTNSIETPPQTQRETSTFNRMMASAPTFSRPQYQNNYAPQQQHSQADRNMLFTSFSNKPAFTLSNNNRFF